MFDNQIMSCFGVVSKFQTIIDTSLPTVVSRLSLCPDNQLLVSESVNLVALYDLKFFKPVRSWSFPQSKPLTLPAVYDHKRDNMITVQSGSTVTTWKIDEDNKKVSKHTFKTAIAAVLDVEGEGAVVVFVNGACQMLSKATKTKKWDKNDIILAKEEIANIAANRVSSSSIKIFILTKLKSQLHANSLYSLSLNTSTGEVETNTCRSVKIAVDFWSLNKDSNTFIGIKQANDASFVVYSFEDDEKDLQSSKKIVKLASTCIETVLGVTFSDDYKNLCLVGQRGETQFVCEVWNLKYQLKRGEFQLSSAPLKNDCHTINNSIFICCPKSIVKLPITERKLLLADVIGSAKSEASDFLSPFSQIEEVCQSLDLNGINDLKGTEKLDALVNQIVKTKLYVPERIIVKILNSCLIQMAKGNVNEKFAIIFQMILILPFNQQHAISSLRKFVEFENVLLAIKSLIDLLPSNNVKIIDWITVFIDAFLDELRSNQHLQQEMSDVLKNVDNCIKFYENLSPVKTLVECRILNKSKCSEINLSIGQYSIEKISF